MPRTRQHIATALLLAALPTAAFVHGCGSSEGSNDTPDADADASTPSADGATPDASAAETSVVGDSAVEAAAEAGVDAGIDAGPCPEDAPVIPALKIEPVSTATFASGVFAAQAPGSDDWYVLEQTGIVHILRNGSMLPTPFLDLSGKIGTNPGERGLLGIAFHPSYATNGRFFVMVTGADGSSAEFLTNTDRVAEYKRSAANADVADATKVQDLVVLPGSAANHNGGTIAFGPDGMLYVGTGDGGGGCESSEPGAVQDTTKLWGKILRLDVDKAAPFAAAGNPFADDPRVYHYGLRNPFRWGFDSLTGDLFIGDVGQSSYEEISVAVGNAAGKNFGWPAFEGDAGGTCGAGKTLGGPSPYTPPILSIDRTGATPNPFSDYSSVIGGRVYRGSAIPSLFGVYMFGDFGAAEVGFLRYCNGTTHGPVAVEKSKIPTPTGTPGSIAHITEGHDHEIYIVYGYGAARLGKLVAQ